MSGSDREPEAPSFERVREHAKRLLRSCRAGDPEALARVCAQLPRLASLGAGRAAASVKLADVQHALAREAKLESWAALKHHVEAAEPLVAQVQRFMRALHEDDLATLRRVLEGFPQVARTSIHAACVACDLAAVDAWLARDPAQATARFGETSWTPLECLAASPLFSLDAARAAASVAIGERLLARGADPNSHTVPPEGDPAVTLTALYRAAQNGNAPLVRLLLEHDANPNDGESVYHAAERNHREVLALLLAHGAEISAAHPHWTNTVLYYLACFRDRQARTADATEGMRWLLEHGADPNVTSYAQRETPLHRVAALGRDPAVARMLLDHGADPAQPRADGRTAYEMAVRVGNVTVAGLLRERGGAPAELRPEDAFLAAAAVGDLPGALRLGEAHPGLAERVIAAERGALVAAADARRYDALRALVALGFDLAREGSGPGTPLHWVAWHGDAEAARELLALGAPIGIRDRQYGSTPLAWAAHGSANCRDADEDYLAVVDLLLDAGSTREPSYNRWGEPPEALASEAVAEHLRSRGFAPPE